MATEESLPVPASQPQGFKYKVQRLKKSLTTKEGLIGDYDYGYLFKPNLPFVTKELSQPPFFGLYDYMPWLLATLLGFQHALAMLAGVVTPSLILSSASGVNLPADVQQYLVSTSLIVCGILSAVQITRFRILKTSYHIGTGLISVVGTTFAIIPVATGYFSQMYANGTCKLADDGSRLPCPDAYGAVIGTACVCALLEIGLAFVPPRILHKIFPPIVTGPTVMLIGASLVQTGFQSWAGGSGPCNTKPADGFFMLCPDIAAPHALPWGSAQFIGLGFLVFVTILLCERFGSPIMRSASVICGLLTGCIVAGATGYFDRSTIDAAPAVSFIWVHTFKLSVSGPLVLPMLMIYLICACEAIGDITATSDVSNLEVEGPQFDSRIQGGVLADGCNSLLAALMTMTPMTTFAQNNGVIALTRCANRKAGYFACFFLIIMGIFSKFAAALTAIPASVLGGMTTFLFASVAVSGIAIIAREPFTRRNRFILTAALAVGYGATLVPTWFDSVFTYKGDNRSLQGFFDAIVLVLETGFAVTALLAIILNLSISQEPEDSTQLDGKIPAHESEENLESKEEKAVAPKVQDIEIA